MTVDSGLSPEVTIHTVNELNLAVRAVIDEAFELLWIRGEISNFACPGSNHWYFTLKDTKAQVRCAMFRGKNMSVGFMPENGMEVVVLAKAGLYPERGEFQLVVDKLQLSGEGQLQKAFDQLKKKLEQEGLFDPKHKKPLPTFPQRLGVITSPTGAAIRDILSVLKRRYPLMEVYIYPAMVQGAQAAPTLVRAIELANQHKIVDVLMVARGGGSLEDLWPFNEESVARAIYASELPIISGVGHETDFTIADFVADLRAPTPSAAAETISPDGQALQEEFAGFEQRLTKLFQRKLQDCFLKVDHLEKRLGHPLTRLQQTQKELQNLLLRLNYAQQQRFKHLHHFLKSKLEALKPSIILMKIQRLEQSVLMLDQKQQRLVIMTFDKAKSHFQELARALHVVSPLATLDRGYSITLNDKKHIITRADQCQVDEVLHTRLLKGIIQSRVVSVLLEES